MQVQILIVDDDKDIGLELKKYLEPHGFKVLNALNGQEMWKILKSHHVDLIVLDIMMPGEDGITLCQKLRIESPVPIIMLSAAGSEADRVSSLEIGADDFLAKPFSARELLARIKALLRRSSGQLGQERLQAAPMSTIHFAHWELDRARRILIGKNGLNIPLSQREFEILTAFLNNPNRILTRDHLLEYTRGIDGGPFDRSIDVQVGRLRKKIELDPKNPQLILTVRGGGYQFNSEATE